MFTDYKFWFIKRDNNGFITECAVRFYEGDYQVVDGEEKYIRTKRLQTYEDLKHLKSKDAEVIKGLKEDNGNIAIYYTLEDFGQIKTDEELCDFLNKELKKDKGRKPIKEQKI